MSLSLPPVLSHTLQVFRDDSAGSFYHAARIIETLLRVLPSEVYTAIISDGLLEERMRRLVQYIGCPPVGDLLAILIGLTPLPRASPLFVSALGARRKFFQGLAEWIFLLRLTEAVVRTEEVCIISEFVPTNQHCSAAAQSLSEIVERLSNDDIGEILLQPLGFCSNLIESLLRAGTETIATTDPVSPEDITSVTRRRAALKFLCFLLKKSANEQNVIYLSGGPNNPPIPSPIPNRLYPSRAMIVDHFLDHISLLEEALFETTASTPSSAVNHPGHACLVPFSSHRTQLVELLVLVVEASPSSAQNLSTNLWKLLIGWNFEYSHNNIYHSMFYKLIFAVLRSVSRAPSLSLSLC
jgi:hypothetical protein